MCSEAARSTRAFGLAVLLLAALALAGCGKKGDPLPPVRYVPLTTSDLQVRQQGRSIFFDMSYPNITLGGLSLEGIDAVELLQLVKPMIAVTADEGGAPPPPLPSAEARELQAGGRTLLTLRGSELAAAVVGDRIQFRIPLAAELPAEPLANIFAVRTIKGDETSAISNRATLVPIEPPAAPSDLVLEPFADGIEVRWQAADASGFDVFRREARLRGYGAPIRRVAGDQRSYRDAQARFDERYIYTVRAVASTEPLIYSEASGEQEIEYQDTFAPPLPPNLVALAERASVRLRWDPSDAADVAGYVIYRREPARDFHRLNKELITGTELVDRNLTSGFTYAYRIQVVDEKGNASELSAPVETTAR